MAYSAIPTRTSASSVLLIPDLNQLQSNITAMLTGIAPYTLLASDPTGSPASGYIYLYFKTDKKLYKKDSAGTVTEIGASGGGTPDIVFNFPAGSFDYPVANPAPLNTRTLTNGNFKEHLMDASTPEFVLGQLQLPASLTGYTKVYLEAQVSAVTAAASKYVELTFEESHAGATEDADVAYTSLSSGDIAITNTQDAINYASWSETISTLAWAANDLVRFKLSRTAPTGTNLSGDLGLINFRIRLSAT